MRIRPLPLALLVILTACGDLAEDDEDIAALESSLTIPASVIPGKVEAENFKVGTQGDTWSDTTPSTNSGGAYRPKSGVDIQACQDAGGGYDITAIQAGEWLTYEVDVAKAAQYAVTARVASGTSGTKSFELQVDGKAVSTPSFTDASGVQSWKSVAAGSVSLAVGKHTLKFVAKTGGFNFNYLSFAESSQPQPGGPTLLGSSIKGALFSTLGRDKVPVTRVYLTDIAAGRTWNDYSDLRFASAHSTEAVWVSFKEEDPARVDAFLATAPKDGMKYFVTYFHEPEDNVTTDAGKTAYRATWQKMGTVIRKHGMTPTLILMKYTLEKSSGRNWRDYYEPGSVDVLGWDSYRKGAANTYDMANQLAEVMEVYKATGLPWAIGETGSTSLRYTAADTAKYATALRAFGENNGASAMCWWDQDTFKFDATTAKNWLD